MKAISHMPASAGATICFRPLTVLIEMTRSSPPKQIRDNDQMIPFDPSRPVLNALFSLINHGSILTPHGPSPRKFPPLRVISPEGPMRNYRAYLIDRSDRVVDYKAVPANTDREALEMSRQYVDGHDVEVWYLDRMVGRLTR